MPWLRQVFRAGIEYSHRGGAWVLSTEEVPTDLARFEASLGPRPVLVEDAGTNYRVTHLLLRSGESLGLELTGLMGRAGDFRETFRGWKEVSYLLGAAGYHCMHLAETYARVRTKFVEVSRVPGAGDDERVVFGNWPEVFYELDAVLGVARRTLDMSRFILWRFFGSRSGCPSNFKKTLDACVTMPAALKDRLERVWSDHGERMTAYRDCIMHYTSLDRGFGSVDMDRTLHGVWMARAHLPDNPESRSQRKFTYANGIDALDYAQTILSEIFESMRALSEHNAAVVQERQRED